MTSPAESRVDIITANCKRCDWSFRYIRQRYGRRRYYCEVCRVLEAMDANDARPRKTAQVRPSLRTHCFRSARPNHVGA